MNKVLEWATRQRDVELVRARARTFTEKGERLVGVADLRPLFPQFTDEYWSKAVAAKIFLSREWEAVRADARPNPNSKKDRLLFRWVGNGSNVRPSGSKQKTAKRARWEITKKRRRLKKRKQQKRKESKQNKGESS